MDVTNVGASPVLTSVSSATQGGTGAAATDPLLPAATQSSISPEGSLFQQLADLARSDPARFKQATAEVAQKLKEEAGQATGKKAEFLSRIADRFDQASQTGDASALQPQRAEGAHGHGHRHHHGASGAQGNTSPFESLAQLVSAALQDVGASSTATATATAATSATAVTGS